jgi:hypothetical protein
MSPNHTPVPAKPPTPGRARRSKAMAAATLALVLGTGTLAAAAPAQAASTAVTPPCAVTAEKPFHNNTSTVSGKKNIVYRIKVSCWEEGAKVQLRQRLMEADEGFWPFNNADDVQRNWFDPVPGALASKVGTQNVDTVHRLVNLDDALGLAKAEVYHNVKFRVVDRHGNASEWITVTSAQRSISPL